MEVYPASDVTLRPFAKTDADYAVQWYTDEKVSRFCQWNAFTSKESAIAHFLCNDIPRPWSWKKAICLAGRPVGSITVTPCYGSDKCRAEIGYVVASDYWGKGVATRAVKMAANAVFMEWGHLERLEAVVDVENTASQRVLEKAGFKREGVLRKYFLLKGKARDAVVFSLLSTEAPSKFNNFVDFILGTDNVTS